MFSLAEMFSPKYKGLKRTWLSAYRAAWPARGHWLVPDFEKEVRERVDAVRVRRFATDWKQSHLFYFQGVRWSKADSVFGMTYGVRCFGHVEGSIGIDYTTTRGWANLDTNIEFIMHEIDRALFFHKAGFDPGEIPQMTHEYMLLFASWLAEPYLDKGHDGDLSIGTVPISSNVGEKLVV